MRQEDHTSPPTASSAQLSLQEGICEVHEKGLAMTAESTRPKRQLTGDIPFQRPRMLSVRTTFKSTASIPTRPDLKADKMEAGKKTKNKKHLDPVVIKVLPIRKLLGMVLP